MDTFMFLVVTVITFNACAVTGVQAGLQKTSPQRPPASNTTRGPTPYCCGVAACKIPVPQPPMGLPKSAAIAAQTPTSSILKKYANASRTFQDPHNVLPGVPASPTSSSSQHSSSAAKDSSPLSGSVRRREGLTLCAPNSRKAVANFTGIHNSTSWVVSYWADLSPNSSCKYTRNKLLLTGCTGNQIAPHLVLTAAHCVDIALKREDTECEELSLVRVVLCYGFNRQPGASKECSNGVEAMGVSWHNYPATGSPHDQAIVFTAAARPGPYFQYQYIENLAGITHLPNNTFQALTYSGDGSPAGKSHPRCGCQACPSVPCGLAQTGPAAGPLSNDPMHVNNGAVGARLEGCGGSSGSCMTINGKTCCFAVDSYSRNSDPDPCTSLCNSYWSSISAAKPLSELWSKVQYALPR